MPNPLISFRLDPELLDALDRFAQDNGLDRTTVIRNAISQYINVPIDPIDDRLTALEGRVAELELRLGTTDSGTAFLLHPKTPDTGDGISQTELARLCKCNDRKLKAVRDRPDELRQFTLERTGQAYEYRDGKYFLTTT